MQVDQIPHPELAAWVASVQKMCNPKEVYLCDGSHLEREWLFQELISSHTFVPLNPEKRPGSYWCRSDPDDVARVEESTFICSTCKEDAGPTNNWKEPVQMRGHLLHLFAGCMEGRRMYVIPFSMGPVGADIAQIGVQITDSPYVAASMGIMTRMGTLPLKALGSKSFVRCLHSVGVPLKEGIADSFWPCNPKDRCIVHFPEEREIWSFGSGYGGNALLGKKCLALRIASVMGRDAEWMAEHMLIVAVIDPNGKRTYFVAAFPSACGKTNLAMLSSSLPGWRIECVGDDIAWLHFKEDGRLYAINPESGFFGVAPGTSYQSNPSAMETISRDTIFTNVALTPDRDVWWEGMAQDPPLGLIDWHGNNWELSSKEPAAHPNARFTVAAKQCPTIDPAWNDPEGVPISGIIFGGRRSTTVPLVFEAFNWNHGVFLGSSMSSEMTAAAKGTIGKLRHDPFAMLPFCGYHMGDYFRHWIEMGKKGSHLPKIFQVNWFRKSKEGKFLWPGFAENMRVLKWMCGRIEGKERGLKTPIGIIPAEGELDLSGLEVDLQQLLKVDVTEYTEEALEISRYFDLFEEKLPSELQGELKALQDRLSTL